MDNIYVPQSVFLGSPSGLIRNEDIRQQLDARSRISVPVNRLPFESLSAIFHSLTEIWPLRSYLHDLGWIKVTHVCQQWRAAACQDATLWTAAIVDFPLNEQWSLEIIRRIRSTPFRFSYSTAYSIWVKPSFVKSLLETHLYHVKDLILRINLHVSNLAIISSGLLSAAPCLERVAMKMTPEHNSFLFPLGSLCSHAPALRSICLKGMAVRWGSYLSHNSCLEELRVGERNFFKPMKSRYRPSALDLASILSRLPNLRVLQLSGCLPLSTDDFHPVTSIHLSKLSLLYIGGTITECTAILEALTVPPPCALNVHCRLKSSESAHHLAPIFIRVSSHLCSDTHSRPIQTFSVETAGDDHTIRLTGWRELREGAMAQEGPTASAADTAAFTITLYLKCDAYTALNEINALWEIVHSSLPLQETRYLAIHVFNYDISTEDWNWNWVDQLAPFIAVTRCRISDIILEHSQDFFLALRHTNSSLSQLLLPSLTSLCITYKCGTDSTGDDEEIDSHWTQCRDTLVEVLRHRKESGFGVQELVLEEWFINAEFEGLLLSIVSKVTFARCYDSIAQDSEAISSSESS